MNKKFYYHVKATNDENVGIHESENEDDALKQLNDIYAPPHPLTNAPHKNIKVELISKAKYETEKKRIDDERLEQSNKTESEPSDDEITDQVQDDTL